MEFEDPRFQHLLALLNDYDEFVLQDDDLQGKLWDLLNKFIQTGEDATDEEILGFEKVLKDKIEKYVKEKAN